MSERWAIFVAVTVGPVHQSGAGVATEIIHGYTSQEQAEKAARLIREGISTSRTATFPYYDDGEAQ